jgi:multisubunit Na+/H+ antiporter MnhC subunit
MFKHFIMLEWKSFLRSASFGTNLAMKIIMGLVAVYFLACFAILGTSAFFILEKSGLEPLQTVNKFIIYYFAMDLVIRYFLQKMPVMNIRPLLNLNIKKATIVHFSLGKTALSFFNFTHALFFIPFTIVLLVKGYGYQAILWNIAMFSLVYFINFINILINNKDAVFYGVLVVFSGLAATQYYNIFDITAYTQPFFQGMYDTNYLFLIPVVLLIATYYFAFRYFKNHLNLDEGLAKKSDVAKTENYTWLEQFGILGTFLKNDIRLLRRNKRSKTTLIMSVVFIFYGLLFFTNSIEMYDNPAMKVFGAIFVSGGFLFTFGQFIPSWDSAYYQLLMSQNIPYKEYIKSKWWLMVIGTVISTLIASFYLYFGLHTYLIVVAVAIFNIGVNSHLVMLGGAFVKTPIDLSTSKQAFGDKQAFNLKTMLIAIPKLLLPMALYAAGYYIFSPNIGLLFVALAGVIGFLFRDYVFSKIEKIYKSEKYATIAAYKQKG